MGRVSVSLMVGKQRDLDEYAKAITDLTTHGTVRSKKHAQLLEEFFQQEQITIFRKQLPFYNKLLASWEKALNSYLDSHVFFSKSYTEHWSVKGLERIALLKDMISMLSDEDLVLTDLFFRTVRQKELQLLSYASPEDGLVVTETPVLFFLLPGKTYDDLLQEYIYEVGLVYFQEEYTRVCKILYYKMVRDLRGALRKMIRFMSRQQSDEEADEIGYKNEEEKTIFKTFFTVRQWTVHKSLNIYGTICSLIKYHLQPGRHWSRLAI